MDLAMGEKFKKAEEALDCIKKLSHKSLNREICGFLGYDYALNQYIVQKEENIAATPSSLFLINSIIAYATSKSFFFLNNNGIL